MRNWLPSFSHCRFILLGDANAPDSPVVLPAKTERCNEGMADCFSCGRDESKGGTVRPINPFIVA